MAESSVLGRGRGRGRALPTSPGTQSPPATTEKGSMDEQEEEKLPDSGIDFIALLSQIGKGDLKTNIDKVFSAVKTANSAEVNDLVIKEAKNIILRDTDEVKNLALLFQKLWDDLPSELKFKSKLGKAMQNLAESRGQIRKHDRMEFRGICVLMCELCRVLRIGAKPVKPFINACYEMLDELLVNDPDLDDLLCFESYVPQVGDILEKQDQVKMDSLMDVMREHVLNRHTGAAERCVLVQMIELRAGGWEMEPDVKRFYVDALTDTISEQFACGDESQG